MIAASLGRHEEEAVSKYHPVRVTSIQERCANFPLGRSGWETSSVGASVNSRAQRGFKCESIYAFIVPGKRAYVRESVSRMTIDGHLCHVIW